MTIRPRSEFRPSTVYEQAEDAVEAALGCEFEFKFPGQDVAYPHNIILTYQRVEGRKHHPFRLKVTWPAVTENVMDEPVDVDGYTVQIQYSPTGLEGSWVDENKRTKVIRDKDANNDGVDDPGPPTHALFYNIKPKKYYRARVRAVGPGGLCKSPFSPWTGAFSAADTVKPSAPLNVALEIDKKRLILTWDHPDDSGLGTAAGEDDDIADNIAYYQWQVTNKVTSGVPVWNNTATYWKKGRTTGDRRTLKVLKPSGTYYARVRSWDAAGNKSNWTPSDNGTSTAKGTITAPSVSLAYDNDGPKGRPRAKVTVTVSSPPDETYHVVAQLAQRDSNSDPVAATPRRTSRLDDDDGSTVAEFGGLKKNKYYFARARIVDADGEKSAWSGWVAGGQPSGASGVGIPGVTINGYDAGFRRFSVDWSDDDEVEKYKIVVKKGSTTKKTLYKKGTQHTYHIPEVDKGASHTMYISAIDAAGNEGNPASATVSEDGYVYATSSDVTSAIGSATIGAGQIDTPNGLSDIDYRAGTITAGTFQGVKFTTNSGSDTNYIEIDGASAKDYIKFVAANDGGTNTLLKAENTGLKIGTGTQQAIGFFGATPQTRKAAPTGSTTLDKLNDLITKLQEYGLLGT